MAKEISVQYDHQRIPILGLVPESSSGAPSTPVNGQLWYDSANNRLMIRESGAWVLASQTGALLTTQRGAANGVASLDASTKVPIAQIPTGQTGTTVPLGNDARFTDQRVPADGSVTGGTAGAGVKIAAATITAANIANATITHTQIAAANIDGAAGTASLRTLGTGATQAAAGNDARFTDQRTPSDNSVTSAKIVDGTIVHGDIAAANKDGLAATPSMRTLGTGAQQAAAGNDTRFTDQRTPTDGSVSTVKIVDGAVTDAKVAVANKDGAAATPSMRTLGSGATQAMAGNTRLDQIAAPTAPVSMNGQRLTGLPAPGAADDPARLADLQAAQAGIDNKPSVRFVAAANKAPTGLTAFEGQTPVAGNRILLTANTTASENGPWIAAAGAWTRPTGENITAQSFWMVEEGPNEGTQWKVNTPDPIVLGTTALTINQWGASGTVYTGTTNRITVAAGAIDIAATYVGQTSITTLGTVTSGTWNATTIAIARGGTGATTALAARANLGAMGKYAANLGALTAGVAANVTHNLNTTDIAAVAFKDTATNENIELGWTTVDANTVSVISDVPYLAGAVRVTVAG